MDSFCHLIVNIIIIILFFVPSVHFSELLFLIGSKGAGKR